MSRASRLVRHCTPFRVNVLESRLAPAALSLLGPYSPEQLTAVRETGLHAWTARAARPAATGAESGPTRVLDLALNDAAMRDHLLAADTLAVPRPDGGVDRFTLWEVSVMDPALAARYPGIRTYRGRGIDNPTATLAADFTYQGFHARVFAGGAGFTVLPTTAVSDGDYQAYFDDDFAWPHTPGCGCPVCAAAFANDGGGSGGGGGGPVIANTTYGANLRTLRTAVAATGEYTALAGGTVPLGLSAITSLMNQVNAIYERDLSTLLQLVPNNDLLIYTDSTTDPYTGNNKSEMLGENQANVDSVIGSANYDVGHVIAAGNLGGVAYLGVVGNPGFKAQGVSSTGSGGPAGNYVVGVTAHEFGHMFAAGHTFNGAGGTLTNNRMSASAWEPGSGSTIMSYGGNSQATPTQDYSGRNLDFHAGSINQMVNFLNTIPAVGTTTPTNNAIPTVSAGPDRAIPANTPFVLTMTASDADGDALTYSWEQMDLGPALSLGSPDNGQSPIFRVYPPSTSPTRYFPNLTSQLNNTYYAPETLPSTNRTMTMRALVRDNKANHGAINTDDVILTVVNTGTPFRVTAPNSAVNWGGNSSQLITWDVAGTTAAPIGANLVNIRLSTDGGQTWPTLLATNSPNDGSEVVIIPNTPIGSARIKVEPTNNVFYDFSDSNFTISTGTSMKVTASTPVTGDVVAAPLTTIDLTFSNDVKASTVGTSDLVLSTGTVTDAQVLSANSVRYTVGGIANEGVVTVTLPTGAVTDTSDNAAAQFVMVLNVDVGTVPFPSALAAVLPAGSLVHQGTTPGAINTAGDTDAYTLPLAAGQSLSLTLAPDAALRPSVTLTGPGGVNVVASASAVGQFALLPATPLPEAGDYTITVAGVAGSSGKYTLTPTVNAAVEAEWKGLAANNSIATAQPLAGSATPLGGGAVRYSALGLTDPLTGFLPAEVEPNDSVATANDASKNFSSFSSNLFQVTATGTITSGGDADWFNVGTFQIGDVVTITMSGTGGQRGTLQDAYVELYRGGDLVTPTAEDDDSGPSGGPPNDSLIYRFTIGVNDTYYVRARAYDSSGSGTYSLNLFLENTGTAPTTGGNTTAESEPNNSAAEADNLASSWRAIPYRAVTTGTLTAGDVDYVAYQFTSGDRVSVVTSNVSGPDTRLVLRNSAGTVLASEDGTSGPLGNTSAIYAYRITTTGTYYVEVGTRSGTGSYTLTTYLSSPTAPAAPTSTFDYYALPLTAGEATTFGLELFAAGSATLELVDGSNAVVAAATAGPSNLDVYRGDFVPSAGGTYYLRVQSTTALPYHVLAVTGAGFNAEPNNDFAGAQAAPAGRVLGGVSGTDDDWYQVAATAGQAITLTTTTPGGGLNPLDPAIDLYDPTGALVGSDDNSAGDGRNATLVAAATQSGIYRARVRSVGGTAGDYVLTMAVSADPPPSVSGPPVVNDGAAQRSRVDSLTVTFSEIVTLGSGAFVLTRTGPGTPTGPVTVAVDTSGSTPTQTVAQLTFSGSLTEFSSLVDGLYTLTVVAAQVTDAAAQTLFGGDYAFDLHRLFGDIDGDRDVDATDFGAFRAAFGTTSDAFDFDDDGDVDAADFGAFRQRFGTSV
jgi:hypothetical protein